MIARCFLIVATLLICSNLWAVSWNDLEPQQKYLSQVNVKTSNLHIALDQPFKFLDINTDSERVIQFLFSDLDCTDMESESDLILTILANNSEVGMKHEKNCLLSIYIEPYQYYDESFVK